MTKIEGRVSIDGSVAYMAQTAWIVSASLKNNVLMGKPLDEQRYQNVLEVCDLQQVRGVAWLDVCFGGCCATGRWGRRVSSVLCVCVCLCVPPLRVCSPCLAVRLAVCVFVLQSVCVFLYLRICL